MAWPGERQAPPDAVKTSSSHRPAAQPPRQGGPPALQVRYRFKIKSHKDFLEGKSRPATASREDLGRGLRGLGGGGELGANSVSSISLPSPLSALPSGLLQQTNNNRETGSPWS